MQWIEVSIVCERVATDEVTTLFDDYADNGIIEEDIEEQPNLIKLTLYADPTLDADVIKEDLEKTSYRGKYYGEINRCSYTRRIYVVKFLATIY